MSAKISNMPQKSMIKYGKIDLESVEKEVEKQA
jgi:hypothetical protein